MKRSREDLNDSELEDEVLDTLYDIVDMKSSGTLSLKEEEDFLKTFRLIPEENPIYCDDGIDRIEDYYGDVVDYISFAEKKHKEDFLNLIEQQL